MSKTVPIFDHALQPGETFAQWQNRFDAYKVERDKVWDRQQRKRNLGTKVGYSVTNEVSEGNKKAKKKGKDKMMNKYPNPRISEVRPILKEIETGKRPLFQSVTYSDDPKSPCKGFRCQQYAFNNALAPAPGKSTKRDKPVLGVDEWKEDLLKHHYNDTADYYQNEWNKIEDKREYPHPKTRLQATDYKMEMTARDRKYKQRKVARDAIAELQGLEEFIPKIASGEDEKITGYDTHWRALYRRKTGIDPKPIQGRIRKKGTYLVVGYSNVPGLEGGSHIITIRDGVIFDNLNDTPIPYTKENLERQIRYQDREVFSLNGQKRTREIQGKAPPSKKQKK